MKNGSEFYVGYLPTPPALRRFLPRLVASLAGLAVAVAAALAAGQHVFEKSTFEFQDYRSFHGVMLERPYPMLAIEGQGMPWLLTATGKHGAAEMLRGLEGREVDLRGSRIYRGGDHMIEVLPQSVHPTGAGVVPETVDLGEVRLQGEIVDSKCYLGVMNPGSGKVHRDCAARCISGGIPPALLVRDASGRAVTVLLANDEGAPVGRAIFDYVAEPIAVSGRLSRIGGRLALRANPIGIHRGAE